MNILTGTYSKKDSLGIYKFNISEEGNLSNAQIFYKLKDSKYICEYENLIFSIITEDNKSGVCIIDKNENLIDKIFYEENSSCYICVIDDYIYTTNYHTGNITKISFKNEKNAYKLSVVKSVKFTGFTGAHMLMKCEENLVVSFLLNDEILILDENLNIKNNIKLEKNQGPRHMIYLENKGYLYVLCEKSCELIMIDFKNNFKKLKTISLIKNYKNNPAAAAIRINNDKNILYISIRGDNTILIIDIKNNDMKILQTFSINQKHPRDILNVLEDKYIIVLGMETNDAVSYKIKNNTIEKEKSKISIPEGVSIIEIKK